MEAVTKARFQGCSIAHKGVAELHWFSLRKAGWNWGDCLGVTQHLPVESDQKISELPNEQVIVLVVTGTGKVYVLGSKLPKFP